MARGCVEDTGDDTGHETCAGLVPRDGRRCPWAALAWLVGVLASPAFALQAAAGGGAPAGEVQAPAIQPDAPRDVTQATLSDPLARAALEQPGEVVFEDGFEPAAAAGEAGSAAAPAATPAPAMPAPATPAPATPALGTRALGRYFEVRGARTGLARVVEDADLAHTGRHALQLTSSAAGGGAGAGVSAWLPGTHPRLHLRYYLKYAGDYDAGARNHTGGALAGIAGSNRWRGMGTAGRRPAGDDYFLVHLETGMRAAEPPPGGAQVYAYWPGMRPDGRGDFWGNILAPSARRAPERGRWTAHELMVRASTPGVADGELAVWIDGQLYLHVQGIRWRDSPEVLLRRFSLDIYVHDARRVNRVWYDDVVVATGYVGP